MNLRVEHSDLSPRLFRVLAIGIGYAALNLATEPLQAFPGVALIYLPSALGIFAGTLWPIETLLGVFVGTLATPWSSGFVVLHLFFAFGNAAEAAIPGLVLRSCSEKQCVGRVVLWTCILNTGFNWFVARLLPSLLGLPGWREQVWLADLSWWLGDVVAVAAFALPLILWRRPDIFFVPLQREPDTPFAFGSAIGAAMMIVLASSLMLGSDYFGLLPFNWLALLYLIPIGFMTAKAGFRGALWANAFSALAYLIALGLESSWVDLSPLMDTTRMLATHANFVMFSVFALAAGTLRTRNLRLMDELETRWLELRRSFEGLVGGLAAAIEARDPGTHRHVDRVALWAVQLAQRVGCSEAEVENIRWGGILHDIGKIGVPDEILFKPGPLSPEEYRVMETHVELGAQIVERAEVLPEAVPLIRYHEERWDGANTGAYPGHFGLRGTEIPLGARIIAVVDAFDAMTSDRPYRKALSFDEAVRQLKTEAGSQFDPGLVKPFLRLLEECKLLEVRTGKWKIRQDREAALQEGVAAPGDPEPS